jgi:hypothetical protein
MRFFLTLDESMVAKKSVTWLNRAAIAASTFSNSKDQAFCALLIFGRLRYEANDRVVTQGKANIP